jgi:hypothetical protein
MAAASAAAVRDPFHLNKNSLISNDAAFRGWAATFAFKKPKRDRRIFRPGIPLTVGSRGMSSVYKHRGGKALEFSSAQRRTVTRSGISFRESNHWRKRHKAKATVFPRPRRSYASFPREDP